jgi:hypothetical protein
MARTSRRLLDLWRNPQKNFTIAVYGNSITKGHGLDDRDKERWSAQLETVLRDRGFPNVKVADFSQLSSTSQYILSSAREIQQTNLFANADIHLVDYTYSDVPPILGLETIEQVEDITRDVIRFLLSQQSKPAVVYLETFVSYEFNAICRKSFARECNWGFNCLHTPDEFPHWKVLQELQVPTITYTDLVCPTKNNNSAGWSFGDRDQVNYIHPRSNVHKAIAHTVAASLLQWIYDFCISSKPSHEHPTQALVLPSSAPYLCSMHTILDFDAAHGVGNFVASTSNGWEFKEDVPEKPGWIATSAGISEISFDLPLNVTSGDRRFDVRLTFLQTYENIGNATCRFADLVGTAETLVGHIDAHVSVPLDHVFKTKLPPGRHTLVCRSDGRKFKITRLRVC